MIIGRCRRHSPTMGGYPVVFNDDFCGDHKIDENKLIKPQSKGEDKWIHRAKYMCCVSCMWFVAKEVK